MTFHEVFDRSNETRSQFEVLGSQRRLVTYPMKSYGEHVTRAVLPPFSLWQCFVVDFVDFILAQAGSFSRKICTYRRSAPLAQPISLYKRCPPVPTSWMLVDFTGRRKVSGKSHQILVSPKYVHLVVQPLASSLTKMAAPANNRKQFPLRAVSADAPLAMRSRRVLLRVTSSGCRRRAHVG